MRRKVVFFLVILVGIGFIGRYAWARETSCQACHGTLQGHFLQPVTQWKKSIHGRAGIACVACHGGDPEANVKESAHNEEKGWIGKPGPVKTVRMCGTCHADERFMKKFNPNIRTDQLKNYLTSNHGINIMVKEDGRGATCVSCHGAHDILKAVNPQSRVYPTKVVDTCAKCHSEKGLMAQFGIRGNEVSEYKRSVHAKALYEGHDLSAPTCNDCHGNHGAVPAGAASIEDVCGTCHMVDQKLFDESPHKTWKDMGLKGCMECHGNHAIQKPSDDMLAPRKGVCYKCHEPGEKGLEVMRAMYMILTGMKKKMEAAREMVDTASEKGMFMDDALLILQDARNYYIQSHTAVHKFSEDYLRSKARGALSSVMKAKKIAEERLAEVKKRRTVFYWFGGLILILILLLSLKIHLLERGTGK